MIAYIESKEGACFTLHAYDGRTVRDRHDWRFAPVLDGAM